MNKKGTKLFATLMLTAMVLSIVPLFKMAKAVPDFQGFLLSPYFPTFYGSLTRVGDTFNETLYVLTWGSTFTYQYEVDYNTAQLNCTYAAYTAGATSQFFADHTTVPTGPDFTSIAGKISGGETLLGADSKGPTPGGASIIIMTFNITQGPPIGGILASLITANNANSFLLDPTLTQVYSEFNDAVYTYYWGLQPYAMKTLCTAENRAPGNGYFYVPSIPYRPLHLIIEMLFNDSNLAGDQFGGVSPYLIINAWPDGTVDMRDIGLIAHSFGSVPDGPRWNYLADLVPDKVIDMRDIGFAAKNFLLNGTYLAWPQAGVTVVFDVSGTQTPDSNGFVPIGVGDTNFTVYQNCIAISAMVTFWNP